MDLLFIYGFSILFAILDCSWLYKGLEDYTSLAWISAAVRVFGLITLFLLIRTESDILKYAWISVLLPAATSIVELFNAERKWKLRIIHNLKSMHHLLKQIKVKFVIPEFLIHSLIGCFVAGLASFGAGMLFTSSTLRGLMSFGVFGVVFCIMMLILHDSLYCEVLDAVRNRCRRGITG